ncbi:hypothetical protein [Effusibacillus lacus]|uniref:IS4 family transposase n=1 Tax=Effusibacillus lacus TaxID=1348429 RepID=A0A292YLN0_9BACL|nr:hypothetical protein [Effusibacillus lacus]TCS69523.1 hypothetical protein EDD64_13640 [Effusibacillus lacus]GAX90066.1 IS4 family transposase [Effusibacillus lacus]
MVQDIQHHNQLQSTVFAFFKEFRIGILLKRDGITKSADITVLQVFRFVFELVFVNRSLPRVLQQKSGSGFEKDTMYRNNRTHHAYNGRKFLVLLGASVVQKISQLTSDDRADVLIVDDSLFSRNRSKKVELRYFSTISASVFNTLKLGSAAPVQCLSLT